MKTINLTLYTFDDLSEEVQKIIIDRERWNIMEQCMEGYGSEYRESLNKFEKLMNISVSGWNVDYCSYLYFVNVAGNTPYEWKYEHDGNKIYDYIYLENLSGKLLVRYLQNYIVPHLLTNKYYLTYKYVNDKPETKSRHSKIIKECACPLTGMCYDMYLIGPILEYLQKPNMKITYEDLMNECVESFFKCWHEEYEYWADNEDAIREELHNNQFRDQLYYKDGNIYDGPLEDVA